MTHRSLAPLAAALALLAAAPAAAHFAMALPDETMPDRDGPAEVAVEFSFSHPFEGEGMPLVRPASAGAITPDGPRDLTADLAEAELYGAPAWTLTLPLESPGVHILHMSMAPYWEPAEDVFIVHHAKAYFAAYGVSDGWDALAGLPVEIKPMAQPFGLWEGNVFTGQVLRDGEPVPFAGVEVEHLADGARPDTHDLMITQSIVADENGVFSYAPPGPGWWGFAALMEADETMEHEGEQKAVELGAVLWVRFEPW